MTKSYLFDLLKKTWERDITADEAMFAIENEIEQMETEGYMGKINHFNGIKIEDEQP